MRRAIHIDILKQLVAWEIAALLDNSGEAPVSERYQVFLAALSPKLELQLRAGDPHVFVLHRGKSERFVVPRVLFVARANESRLEQLHRCSQRLLARQPTAPQVAFTRARIRACTVPKAIIRLNLASS
jgi:hypothetical protein